MRNHRRSVTGTAAALFPAVVLLLGCSTPTETTAHQPEPAAPATPTTTPRPTLPPRPSDIPLDRLDPCKILTKDQRIALNLDGQPAGYVDSSLGEARSCTIRGSGSGNVARLALVTVQGVNVWLDENAQVDAREAMVGAYPALVVRTPGLETACNVEVDMAEGQFLDVLFRDGGNATPTPRDQLCLGAQRVAEAAVSSLTTKK